MSHDIRNVRLLLSVLVTSFVTLPAMGQDDIIELTRPKGPSLREKANKEWQKTLPSWFKANIKHTRERDWGDYTDKKGFYKDEFQIEHDEIFWKEDGKCWMEERTTIVGDLKTIRYGTMHYMLYILEPGEQEKMRGLWDAATDLMVKKSLEQLLETSPATSILKKLAGQIPIFGKAFAHADAALGAADKIVSFAEIREALITFLKEYAVVERMISAGSKKVYVVTVNGGYDEAVFFSGERKEIHTKSKETELTCEDEFWKEVEEGTKETYLKSSLPIKSTVADELFKGTAADKLFGMLEKDKDNPPKVDNLDEEGSGIRVDPRTGLMWTRKDNGNDVDWQGADRYCNGLTLGGHTDWRLPTIEELGKLDDPLRGEEPNESRGWWIWSSTMGPEDHFEGHAGPFPLYFNFRVGRRMPPQLPSLLLKALCVRRSGE